MHRCEIHLTEIRFMGDREERVVNAVMGCDGKTQLDALQAAIHNLCNQQGIELVELFRMLVGQKVQDG